MGQFGMTFVNWQLTQGSMAEFFEVPISVLSVTMSVLQIVFAFLADIFLIAFAYTFKADLDL